MTIKLDNNINVFDGGNGGGGGGHEHGEYLVLAVDYNGDIIDEQWLNEGDEYTFPNAPQHDGLVFQEWSCSQTPTNNKVTVGKKDIMIGAVYTTASGKNEFDIVLNNRTGLDVTLNMNGTKEWGDGTSDTNTTHTYADYGEYTIKCNGTTLSLPSSRGIFGQGVSYSYQYNKYCKAVRIATITNIPAYSFSACDGMAQCILSKSVTSIESSSLRRNRELKCVIIPTTAQVANNDSFGQVFEYNYFMEYVVIPPSITKAGGSFLDGCQALRYLVFPDTLNFYVSGSTSTSSGGRTIYSCASLERLFLSMSTTRINDDFVYGCPSLQKLVFPDNITHIGSYGGESTGVKEVVFPKKLGSFSYTAFTSSLKGCLLYDFSNVEDVPTTQRNGTYTMYLETNVLSKIIVPWSKWLDWATSNSWELLKDYMTAKGKVDVSFSNISNDDDIFVLGEKLTSHNIVWEKGDRIPYCCQNNISKVVVSKTQANVPNNGSLDIPISFDNSKKITLSIGVSGLTDIFFRIGGVYFDAIEENGNYYLNVVADIGTKIEYFIQDDNYMNIEGEVTENGEDITENITLTPATEQTFVRPDLTANGTIGGDSFAVSDVFYGSSAYPWRAVDNSASTYWNGNYNGTKHNLEFVFYNPKDIKISQLTFSFASSNYATNVVIYGSDDNTYWEKLQSSYTLNSTSEGVLNLSSNIRYYKYYRLDFTERKDSYGYVYLSNIAFTALEKVASE